MKRFKLDEEAWKALRQLLIERELRCQEAYREALDVDEKDLPTFRFGEVDQTQLTPAHGEELHHISYRSKGGGDYETNLIFISRRVHRCVHDDTDGEEKKWAEKFAAYINSPDVQGWRYAHRLELDAIYKASAARAEEKRKEKAKVDLGLCGKKPKKKNRVKRAWPKRPFPKRKKQPKKRKWSQWRPPA